MTSITIDKIDDNLQHRLSTRAAAHGRSLVDEARDILRRALKDAPESAVPGRENPASPPKRKPWLSLADLPKMDKGFLAERPNLIEEGRVKF